MGFSAPRGHERSAQEKAKNFNSAILPESYKEKHSKQNVNQQNPISSLK